MLRNCLLWDRIQAVRHPGHPSRKAGAPEKEGGERGAEKRKEEEANARGGGVIAAT